MIRIDHVSKVYRCYERRSDRLREWLGGSRRHQEVWALRDVDLMVPKGTVYGLIGMNGAGKSTLLKILSGTSQPTTGSVSIEGRVAALLELGTGFHPELTGRDNVLLNGKLLGLTQKEVEAKLDEIHSFSELGDFFERPVRTYSSGMYLRLAFSLAASVEPDVLIVDEALSVGDAYFQQKCLRRIRSFKERGVTILLVSHDLSAIKLLCDRVALLDRGKIVQTGDPVDLLESYNALLAEKGDSSNEYEVVRGAEDDLGRPQLRSGNRKAEISRVAIENDRGDPVEAVHCGQGCRVVVEVVFHTAIEDPTVGVMIRDRLGYDIFGTNTKELFKPVGPFAAGQKGRFVFDVTMNLGPAAYTVTAAAHSDKTHERDCYEWVDRILTFEVLPPTNVRFLGVSYLNPSVSVEAIDH